MAVDIRTGLGKANFNGILSKLRQLHNLRKLSVYHLSKDAATKGQLLGLFNPRQIFTHSRLGVDYLALIEYPAGKRALYMVSKERAKQIWGRR